MTIDMKEVYKAREKIREFEKELMIFVKQFFENEAFKKASWPEGSRVSSKSQDFTARLFPKKNKLTVEVNFNFNKLSNDWTYTISCPEFDIYNLEPPAEKGWTIQGRKCVQLKERIEMMIGGERRTATVEYTQWLDMREYPD